MLRCWAVKKTNGVHYDKHLVKEAELLGEAHKNGVNQCPLKGNGIGQCPVKSDPLDRVEEVSREKCEGLSSSFF